MQTIFCIYETDERFPRFVRSAADAAAAYEDILANALDGHEDDLSVWIASKIAEGKRVARYDLQSDVEDNDVLFFVGYWEGQFSDIVRSEAAEVGGTAGGDATAARSVLEAIEKKEGRE